MGNCVSAIRIHERLSRPVAIIAIGLAANLAVAAGPPATTGLTLERGSSLKEVQARLAKKASNTVPTRLDATTRLEDRGEFYRVGQTTISLKRVVGQYAVRYRPGVDTSAARSRLLNELNGATHIASCKPKRLDLVSVSEDSGETGASKLARSSVVERVFPVYVASEDRARMVVTDEIIVCLDDAILIDVLAAKFEALGLSIVERLPLKNAPTWLLRLSASSKDDTLTVCEKLRHIEGVLWAEPEFARELHFEFTPNDPLFSMQQNLHNTGQNGATSDADVDAPEAWDVTPGSSSIVIAILDDGVDTSHTDLMIAPGGYDFYNNDNDPSPVGTDGHGTGCAGVAAAMINNSYRVSGMAGGCRILPIKIAEGNSFASSVVIGNAIIYAADRADILSCSWGGGAPSSYINAAIDYAVTDGRGGKGCAVFCASGNRASGWYQGGGRYRISMAGISGQYYIGFYYQKDGSGSAGLDAVFLDNVCLLAADGVTHIWRQDFESTTFPPPGWWTYSTPWTQTTSNAYLATGGTRSARSGVIGNNGLSLLLTPLQTITGVETLAFAAYVSTEANKDLFYVIIYTSGGNPVASWGPLSGVPTIATSVLYPANYTNTIAVGAASDCDRRSDYSCYGLELDFVAPSNGGWNDIVTLDPIGSVGWTNDDYKVMFGGTSAACPLAAGIAALRLSYNPNETASSLRSWMRAHCDKIGGVTYSGGEPGAGGRHDEYGYGRVNSFMTVPVAFSLMSVE